MNDDIPHTMPCSIKLSNHGEIIYRIFGPTRHDQAVFFEEKIREIRGLGNTAYVDYKSIYPLHRDELKRMWHTKMIADGILNPDLTMK